MTAVVGALTRRAWFWVLPSWIVGVGVYVAVTWLSARAGLDDIARFPVPARLAFAGIHAAAPLPVVFLLARALQRNARFEAVSGSFTFRIKPAVSSAFVYVGYLTTPLFLEGARPSPMIAGLLLLAIVPFLPRPSLTPAQFEWRWSGLPALPWADLTAVEIVPMGRRGRRRGLRLTIEGPGRRPREETIPLTSAADGTLLAEAVRHYIEHPEHRAAIGTDAELHRLRAQLTAGEDQAGSAGRAVSESGREDA